jgi:hypothetical protein
MGALWRGWAGGGVCAGVSADLGLGNGCACDHLIANPRQILLDRLLCKFPTGRRRYW